MNTSNQAETNNVEARELYMFDELYSFMRESTGITITSAYLLLILTSMGYLYLLFGYFDINVVKYLTFEDILATPIKNPDIILIFLALISILVFADLGQGLKMKLRRKYQDLPTPFYVKVFYYLMWVPKKRKANIKLTLATVLLCLFMYVFAFAKIEAEDLRDGGGELIELKLANDNKKIRASLLGTTINYVFVFDNATQKSYVFNVEAIEYIAPVLVGDKVSSD